MWAVCIVFFFKQKTAYELRISDLSSDVCSSDLLIAVKKAVPAINIVRRNISEQPSEPLDSFFAERVGTVLQLPDVLHLIVALEQVFVNISHAEARQEKFLLVFLKVNPHQTLDRKSTRLNSSH